MKNFLDIFLPRRCAYCKELLDDEYFCETCTQNIQFAKNSNEDPTIALLNYTGIVRELLLHTKFTPSYAQGEMLASYFSHVLKRSPHFYALLSQNFDCVTYVPSNWRKMFFRGFELPALLAKQAANKLQKPSLKLLTANRQDPSLSRASDILQRRALVKDRFTLHCHRRLPMKVLLVDDIFTTGATIQEASKTLTAFGHCVKSLAFAKTP